MGGFSARYFKKIMPIKTTAVIAKAIQIGHSKIATTIKSSAKRTPSNFSSMVITSFPVWAKVYSCEKYVSSK